jgi:FkbM family methyltransferase
MDAWVVHEVINRRLYTPPPPVERALRRVDSPRIVDLGAHIGAATLHFLEHFPTARVLAVEPNPQTAALLRRMVAVNRLEEQCEVRQAAAGVAPGHAAMEGFSILAHLARADTVEAVDEIPALRKYQDGQAVSAEVEVLDIVPLLLGADLVKMDIEGGEWAILSDPRLPDLKANVIRLEWHTMLCPQPDAHAEAIKLLRSGGFTRIVDADHEFDVNGVLWAWRERPSRSGTSMPIKRS